MSTRSRSSRRSNPVVRLALVIAVMGVLIAIGGVVTYEAFRSSRGVPLTVSIYPDAELVGSVVLDEGHDRMRYVTSSSADEVSQFYRQEIEVCTRVDNSMPTSEQPAFQVTCVVDGSSFFITQYTTVIVQPGTGDNAGQTIIQIERVWGQ